MCDLLLLTCSRISINHPMAGVGVAQNEYFVLEEYIVE